MATQFVGDIRNLALVGHSGSGKTLLGEALLFHTGVTKRLGSPDDGSSLLDYDDESKERKASTDSSVFFIDHSGHRLNLIDTPGAPDFCGTAISALAGVEAAVVVISASSGIGVNTRRMFNIAKDYGLARMIVVTKIDAENVDLAELYNNIRETFGHDCHPVNLPAGGGAKVINVFENTEGASDILDVAHAHTELLDAIVETDDSLMNEYMETGTVTPDKLSRTIGHAVAIGHVIPVLFVNSKTGVGIPELLDAMYTFAPSPIEGEHRALVVGEGPDAKKSAIDPKLDGEFIAQVFKVTTDPKSNIKYCIARVHTGTLTPDDQVFVSGDRRGQRPGHFFKLRGNEHIEIPKAGAGDIVSFAKLDFKIGQVLFKNAHDGTMSMPRFPTPMFSLAIVAKARGDIEKVGAALHRFADEDPCFHYHRDADTHELVISGLGDQHLIVIRSKMKRYFKLDVDSHAPKIPYRETITQAVKYVEYTHKKQSGGAGQFAKVAIDMEPTERGKGYEFADKIFGGVIDQAFRPAVDKGCRDQMKKGVITGCQVVDVRVSLVDGKTHPVDSKDIAFQIAGRQAFKKAFVQCKPILLEPVVTAEIIVPAHNMGDITRDISGRRGQVIGQDIMPGGLALIKATVPLAEVASYSSQLKSVTGGQGSYTMEFSHYDVVPPNVQQQIMAGYKAAEDEEA